MNKEQQLIMVEWMEKHGDLSHTVNSAQGRLKKSHLWKRLIGSLHRVASGSIKNQREWAKSWSELKLRTKRKKRALAAEVKGTGGGRAKAVPLTEIEERVAAIIGGRGILGGPSQETGLEVEDTLQVSVRSVREVGAARTRPAQSDRELLVEPPPQIQDEDMYYEDIELGEYMPDEGRQDPLMVSPVAARNDEVNPHEVSDDEQTERPAVHHELVDIREVSDEEQTERPAVRHQQINIREDLQSRVTRQIPETRGNNLPSERRRRRRQVPETPFDRAATIFAQLEERRLDLDQQRLNFEIEREREGRRLLNSVMEFAQEIKPALIKFLTRPPRPEE